MEDKEDDGSAAGENTEPNEESSIQSVSGLINSVRETRAATQKQGTAAGRTQAHHRQHEQKKGTDELEKELQDPPYAPFNTYRLVRLLIEAGYSSEQAKTIMLLFKHQVYETVERVKANMLTKSDLENDAYLFRAALQELRTETQMIRKNDQAILESQLAAIDREIESLAQKINDDISNVRSDIEIEMNNHKHDTSHAMKSLDMKLHELSSKYQFVVGEMKTDVEAIRLESIRHGLLAAVVTTLVLVGIVWAPELIAQLRERDSQARQRGMKSRESGGGANSEVAAAGTQGGLAGSKLLKAGDEVLTSQLSEEEEEKEMRKAAWAANSANGGTAEGPMQPHAPAASQARGSIYRDHSFLNIQYDPTIFSAEQQQQQQQQQNAQDDGYDNWFDSFFNPPEENGKQAERKDKSASLMESDAKLDSTLWSHQPPASTTTQETGNERNANVNDDTRTHPLHLPHEDDRNQRNN
ncbi:hypothetical protein LPJ59_005367 [Coemansia sp. RSA 2399]|nr:hypothetical protein LPJ59_005367 [Coemansia sp. RSA 2399]